MHTIFLFTYWYISVYLKIIEIKFIDFLALSNKGTIVSCEYVGNNLLGHIVVY